MTTVSNEKDLSQAIKNNENEIRIEGDLSRKIVTIKATGKAAWVIAIGSVSVAVILALKTPIIVNGGPPAIAAEGFALTATASTAASIWGIPATIAAISICVAGGSVSILKKLYNGYNIQSKGDKYITLKRK